MTLKKASRVAVCAGIVCAILFFAGITLVVLKVRAHLAQQKALAELKQDNPVKYYILHTPLTQTEDELKNAMVGTWELAGTVSRKTGNFVILQSPGNFLKTFTQTNWAIVTSDNHSNVLYSASGHYTLQGENYTESIEAATGQMKQYLGAHPQFKIRLVGDKYYQMSTRKNGIEEMWQRVGP